MFQILIIDDTKSVHAFVRGLLAKAPEVVVTSVFNGEEGLKLLQMKTDFQIVLLDWHSRLSLSVALPIAHLLSFYFYYSYLVSFSLFL